MKKSKKRLQKVTTGSYLYLPPKPRGSQKWPKMTKIDKMDTILCTCASYYYVIIQNILKKHKNNKQLYIEIIKL